MDRQRRGAEEAFPFTDADVGPLLESLRALELRLREPPSLADVPLDALIGMKAIGELVEIDREANGADGHPIVRRNADLLRDDAVRRWQAATGGPAPDGLQVLMDRLAELQDGQTRLLDRLQTGDAPETRQAAPGGPAQDGKSTVSPGADRMPLFSEVADKYLEMRKGAGTSGVGTARYRLDVFLDVVGDRPIDEYRPIDLQHYVNELQYLPKLFKTDAPAARPLQGMSARQAIDANRAGQWEPLGIKTIQDGYVQVVKATASFAAGHNRIPHPFAGVQMRWPTNAKPQVERSALDYERMDRVFKAGVSTGQLDDALLLPLSFVTSRRIGLLAFLRGSDFIDRHGVIAVRANGIIFDKTTRTWRRLPFKTTESLRFFVLHQFFSQIGFVDWARSQGDAFLFRALHGVKDPAAVASQRCNRLIDSVGAKSRFINVAHSFRHGSKDLMAEDFIDDTSSRLQMGHEISDVHSSYGRRPELSRKESRQLASIKLPAEIDWSIFKNLDFEAMAAKPRGKGRPTKG